MLRGDWVYKENLISVIVPVFNTEEYLNRCLDSIINSTYKELEIICVDDGSTDCSAEILEQYASIDNRITIIHQDNQGVSVARNKGMESAVGEYVCFIDSDDCIHEQFFTYLHRAITENAADIALCDFKRCDESYLFPQPKYDCENLSIYNLMTNQNYKNFVNKLFRHTAISNEHFMSGKVIEDAIYIIDILTKNPNVRIVKVNCTLYAYFQRSGSLVSGISVDLVRHLADYTMQKLVSLEDKNLKGIFAEDVIKRMLYVRYYYLLKKERIAAAECNEVIRSMLTLLSHRKVKYVVLYLIPELYRQFRLRNDPSMKIFEKNVKSSDYQCL